jgi:hypothetical protein
MNIAEMRSAIDLENVKRGKDTLPESAPDWMVRRLFEQRNKMTLTPLPKHVEVRSVASVVGAQPTSGDARYKRAAAALAEIEAENAAEEETLLRLKAQAASFLL